MTAIASHLSAAELEARYATAADPVSKSHFHAIWLLFLGYAANDVAAILSFSVRWVNLLLKRYNKQGPDSLEDLRQGNGAAPATPVFFELTSRLERRKDGLDVFRRLGGHVLIALDGTEYYHAMLGATLVAPGHDKVIPLPAEFIAPQDGADKQDCETAAAKRWLAAHGSRYAALKPIYLGGNLFAMHTVCESMDDLRRLARQKHGSRSQLFNAIAAVTAFLLFPSGKIFSRPSLSFDLPLHRHEAARPSIGCAGGGKYEKMPNCELLVHDRWYIFRHGDAH